MRRKRITSTTKGSVWFIITIIIILLAVVMFTKEAWARTPFLKEEVIIVSSPNKPTPPPVEPSNQGYHVTGRGGVDTENEVENLIWIYFGNKYYEGARRVALCESGLNPKAENPDSTASGPFQILKGTFKQFKCEGVVTDTEDNIRCARKIFDYYGQSFNTPGGWSASFACHQQE